MLLCPLWGFCTDQQECAFHLVRWGDLLPIQIQKSRSLLFSFNFHSFIPLFLFPLLHHLPSDSFLLPTTPVYNAHPFFFLFVLCLAYVLCIRMSTIVHLYVDNYEKTVQKRWKQDHDKRKKKNTSWNTYHQKTANQFGRFRESCKEQREWLMEWGSENNGAALFETVESRSKGERCGITERSRVPVATENEVWWFRWC